MILNWFRNRRRSALAARPFPIDWREVLQRNVAVYGELSVAEQAKLQRYVQVFVSEKNWEGCGGLAMTDEIRVTIAAQVGHLVLGFAEPQYFEKVLSILVYPSAYTAPNHASYRGGVVTEADSDRLGEAWYRGPVILSWADVLAAGRRETHGNVVYHEFAHQLDMLNGGSVDGTPPLETREQDMRWLEINEREFERLVQQCERGHSTIIDCYGATSRAEFFAVATETFFTRATALKHRHPELYAVFCEVYRQDPAS